MGFSRMFRSAAARRGAACAPAFSSPEQPRASFTSSLPSVCVQHQAPPDPADRCWLAPPVLRVFTGGACPAAAAMLPMCDDPPAMESLVQKYCTAHSSRLPIPCREEEG